MAKKSIQRRPKRAAKANSGKSRSPKIRADPIAEFREAIQADGVVEVLTLADDDCLAHVKQHISTGSLALDRLLNGRGVPCGRVTEFFGPPHIGKSTILDHIFARVQAMGGIGVLADTEGARDIRYTTAVGVDPKKLQYLEFPRNELVLENVLTKLMETAAFFATNFPEIPVVLGLDALGSTSTRDERDKGLEKDARVAAAAQVLRKACRLLPSRIGNSQVAVVIANHEYENIQTHGRMGKKRETYGGDAIRHLASLRVQLYSGGDYVKSGPNIVGREVVAKLVKNRLGNPWGEARFALLAGRGISNVWTIYDCLSRAHVIQVSGSWSVINLDGQVLSFQGWQGLERLVQEDIAVRAQVSESEHALSLFDRLVSIYEAIP